MESLPVNLLLFPLMGGYYITTRLEPSKFIGQRKSSQAVFFDAVLTAIPLLFFSLVITTMSTYLFPDMVALLKDKVFPIKDDYFGTCFLSVVIAFTFVKISNWKTDEFDAICRAIEIVGNELEMLFLCSCRESQLIQITLTNNKVYIGWVEIIAKPSQDQYVRLLPFLSGYRSDQTKELSITTDYSLVYSDLISKGQIKAINQADVNLVIKTSEILSASKFDFDYFEKFEASKSSK